MSYLYTPMPPHDKDVSLTADDMVTSSSSSLNMPLFWRDLFFAPGLVFAIHVVSSFAFGAYQRWSWFDIPMHFFGGLSIAVSGQVLLRVLQTQGQLIIRRAWVWQSLLIVSAIVAAVFWEFYEFLLDYFFGTLTQLGLQDTMGDLFFGMLGAMVISFFLVKKRT